MTIRGLAWTVLGTLLSVRADAHAIIVDSVPAPLGHVPAGHLAVALRYNSRIDAARSKLVLRQGENERRLATAEAATPDVLAAAVTLSPGDYAIAWQVLATDGHITRGRIPFTVDAPASAPASAPGARASR